MKKVVSLLLSILMLLSCVTIASASVVTVGDKAAKINDPVDLTGSKIYEYFVNSTTTNNIPLTTITQFGLYYAENGRLAKEIKNNDMTCHLEPGNFVYMVLGRSIDLVDDYKVSSAKIQTTEKEYQKVIANGKCEIVKMRPKGVNAPDKVYVCAKIPVTYIPEETYKSSDVFVYYGELVVKLRHETIYPKVYAVFSGYDVQKAKQKSPNSFLLEETPHVYKLTSTNDSYDRREIHIEDDSGDFMFDAEVLAESETVASINHEELIEIVDLYGEYTDLTFYNASGSFKRLYNIVLSIFAGGEGRYLYRYQDGVLTDLSSYYNEGSDCFEIEVKGSTLNLATYIVSGEKLAAIQQVNPNYVEKPTYPAGSIIVIDNGAKVPAIPNTGVFQE